MLMIISVKRKEIVYDVGPMKTMLSKQLPEINITIEINWKKFMFIELFY